MIPATCCDCILYLLHLSHRPVNFWGRGLIRPEQCQSGLGGLNHNKKEQPPHTESPIITLDNVISTVVMYASTNVL